MNLNNTQTPVLYLLMHKVWIIASLLTPCHFSLLKHYIEVKQKDELFLSFVSVN